MAAFGGPRPVMETSSEGPAAGEAATEDFSSGGCIALGVEGALEVAAPVDFSTGGVAATTGTPCDMGAL